jgi:hypothetical protein
VRPDIVRLSDGALHDMDSPKFNKWDHSKHVRSANSVRNANNSYYEAAVI